MREMNLDNQLRMAAVPGNGPADQADSPSLSK
jgi:hypothetical protein